MRRRALLRATAATTALGSLAGCLDDLGGDDTETETTTTDAGTTTMETETTAGTTTTPALDIESREIQTETTGCGSENAGSIEFTDSGATISGSVPAATPCHEAQYADERVLGGVIELTVGTEKTDAENCQSCLGQIEYSGTVTTSVDPHSLVLVHEYTPEDADEPVTEVVADETREQ